MYEQVDENGQGKATVISLRHYLPVSITSIRHMKVKQASISQSEACIHPEEMLCL